MIYKIIFLTGILWKYIIEQYISGCGDAYGAEQLTGCNAVHKVTNRKSP